MIFEDIIQEKRGQWDNWLLIFHKGVSSQSLDAITRIDRLGQLRTAYQKRLYSECYSICDIWGINDYNKNL